MPQPISLEQLRRALDAPDRFDRLQHRARAERLRESFSHSVAYRELPDGSTCLTYALGLSKDRTYIALAGPFFDYEIFAGKLFVEWLLKEGRLTEIAHPAQGCLVLYFAHRTWKHAGTAASDRRVISQWGTFPVYEHELFEVPARYGNRLRYFKMPDPATARAHFIDFAKHSHGLTDHDIKQAVQYTPDRSVIKRPR